MCGIAGFIDPGKGREVLEAMTGAIARRGPDDFGYWREGAVALGHRRLAIIDLSPAGHQPMEFGNLVTVYNGEIYNYREVRSQLEQLGYGFSTSSDTEVILKAFDRWGPRCVERFIGMFAIAIYDKAERALYLIRDRVGVKPLYYHEKQGRLAFGSELKCFKPYLAPAEKAAISTDALSEYFAFGYISSERSIIEHVRKVPPGHYLKFADGRASLERYWSVSFAPASDWAHRSEDDLLDELDSLVTSAFTYRMVADVPVGMFLSAGVDSSLVTAVLTRHHGEIATFTIGFEDPSFDESADAARIAAHLGTRHTQAILTAEKGHEILDRFYDIYDEPHGDSSCVPTTYVAEVAKQAGMKVVLSADGGDELFGGYTRYVDFLKRWRQSRRLGAPGRAAARAGLRAAEALSGQARSEMLGRYADLLSHGDFSIFYQNMLLTSSEQAFRSVLPTFRRPFTPCAEGPPLSLMAQWDFDHYLVNDILVKVDRATMFHSIEGREPFLDQRVIEFAAKLPPSFKIRDGETKYLLKRLLGRYLPDELHRLPKRGFGVPLGSWIREHYRERFTDVLERCAPVFDRRQVARLLDDYRSGRPFNWPVLWMLFSFQLWHDKWTEREEVRAAA